MIAVILDIRGYRRFNVKERTGIRFTIKGILNKIYDLYSSVLPTKPSLTYGDSIEIVTLDWIPVVHLLHLLYFNLPNLKFYMGIGIGELDIIEKYADDSDGPAFWRARDALREAKFDKSAAVIRLSRKFKDIERYAASLIVMYFVILQTMSYDQIKCSYYYIWEDMVIEDIAKKFSKSVKDIEKILFKPNVYTMKKIITLFKQLSYETSKNA